VRSARSAALALVSLWLAAACTSGGPGEPDSSPGRGTTSPATSSSTPGRTEHSRTHRATPPDQRPQRLTLAFAGDLNFDQQLGSLLAPGDHRLATALAPLLGPADLAMLNLETAITTRGSPEPKTYHFRAPARALDVVASTGVDVVTMANNHAVDYGPVGFADTLAAKADSPIPVVGIGQDAAEAFAPAVFRRAGVSIAVLGSTEIDDLTLNKFPATESSPGVATNLNPARLLASVRAAARRYDLVVVYLHWGLDYTSCPDSIQPSMADRLAGAGADIVVGSHAHRVQGAGWLGATYVDYGLGNFVWARSDGGNGVTGVLTLTVDVSAAAAAPSRPAVTAARWTPLLIGDDGLPRRPDPTTRATMLREWNDGRDCAGLSPRPR
jgi:poly-gamma-glutamate synthesis protein (capsule biosynthesis protein)